MVWFKSIVISIHIFCKTNFSQEQGSIFSHQEICLQNEKMKVWHGKVNNSDYWRPKVNDKFDSVWNNILDKAQHTVAMEQNLENLDFGLKGANVKTLKKNLKMHSGGKPNKCSQCDFACSDPRQAIWGNIWKCIQEETKLMQPVHCRVFMLSHDSYRQTDRQTH